MKLLKALTACVARSEKALELESEAVVMLGEKQTYKHMR